MDILSLFKSGEKIFIEDVVEDNKVKDLIKNVNSSFESMLTETDNFEEFAKSQLSGEYHQTIVKAKSLKEFFSSLQFVGTACENFRRQEEKQIASYNSKKSKLIQALKALLKGTAKSPVVCAYDLYDDEFEKCEEGHEVVILGSHNSIIIETLIEKLEELLEASGHFDEVQGVPLTVNYFTVEKNVELCKERLDILFSNNVAKMNKMNEALNHMEEVGKRVVDFETYKKDLELIGCSKKEMQAYEKSFTKEYIPLKKQLQKAFKIEFVEICDIVVDENKFETAGENETEDFESGDKETAEKDTSHVEDKASS